MKKSLTISMLALCFGATNAQAQQSKHTVQHDPVFRYAQEIVANKTANKTTKTSTVKQRVIAEAGYDIWGGILSKSDSLLFKYSGSNGSKFDYNELSFNPYFSEGNSGNIYDYGEMAVKADTVKHWSGSPLAPYELITKNFTSSTKIKDYRYSNYWDGSKNERRVVDYDLFGKPSSVWLFAWNPSLSQWDTTGKIVFAYNGINMLESDTSYSYSGGVLSILGAGTYVYDWGGNLVSKLQQQDFGWGLIDFVKYSFTYYPNQTIKELLIELDNGFGFVPNSKYEVAHDPANRFITHETAWIYDEIAMAWEPFYKYSRGINLQGLPDTSRFYNWDMSMNDWDMYEMAISIYNTEDNPEKVIYYHPGATGLDVDYLYKFYYEWYNVLSINEEKATSHNVRVYPNPASDFVTVQFEGQSNEVSKIQITNAVGQIVRSVNLGRIRTTEQVSLSGLAPGLYYLGVLGKDGIFISRQSVLKQ